MVGGPNLTAALTVQISEGGGLARATPVLAITVLLIMADRTLGIGIFVH